jgi:hypothetical protein
MTISFAVTPRKVAPPLLPDHFGWQGNAYADHGICRTPFLHSKPPIVLPVAVQARGSNAPDAAGPAAGPPPPPVGVDEVPPPPPAVGAEPLPPPPPVVPVSTGVSIVPATSVPVSVFSVMELASWAGSFSRVGRNARKIAKISPRA